MPVISVRTLFTHNKIQILIEVLITSIYDVFVKHSNGNLHIRFVSCFQLCGWFCLMIGYIFSLTYKLIWLWLDEPAYKIAHSFTALRVNHKQSTVKLMNHITWQKMNHFNLLNIGIIYHIACVSHGQIG